MALKILRTADNDLTRVQQNVKEELDAIQEVLPTKKQPSTAITADYSVRLTDVLVLATPAADINVTLPDVATCVGETFTIKNLAPDAIIHVRGLYRNGAAQVIDGASPYDIPGGTALTVYSDRAKWWVI